MSLMTGSVPHVLDAIGQTPLVRLNQMAAHVPANIYVKLEYLNPGGSTKDRIGLNIINQAEAAGLIQPGGTIVRPTHQRQHGDGSRSCCSRPWIQMHLRHAR